MGRPKKEPTTIINFRIPKADREALAKKYPNLTELFKNWYKSLLK
jgi:hypothetical protein